MVFSPAHKILQIQSYSNAFDVKVPGRLVGVNLTVKAVVDPVNDVLRGRGADDEARLVLLDDLLLSGRKSGDVVNLGNSLVGSVRHNLSCGTRVHSPEAKVGTHVGVVKVDDGGSSKLGDILVIDDGVSGKGDGGGGSGGGGSEEGTTVSGLGVEGGG